jgi:hypothetical protein
MSRIPTIPSAPLEKASSVRVLALILTMSLISACANPGIVQISPNTYMISREDHAGIFGSLARMKANVIREANEYAARQGKVAIPINAKEKPVGYRPADWATFEYQFRLVDPDSPEAQSVHLEPRADIVVETTNQSTIDVRTEPAADRGGDRYDELERLAELRRKGVLTDEEFEAEKRRVLTQP